MLNIRARVRTPDDSVEACDQCMKIFYKGIVILGPSSVAFTLGNLKKTINFNYVKRVTTTPKRSPSGMFSAMTPTSSLAKHGITINAIRSVANVGNQTLKDTSVK